MASYLNYRLQGAGDGPVLLLVPPLGADQRVYVRALALWGPQRRALSIDLRGTGGSPLGPVATLADHVADIEALRAELGIARLVPVGCAVGAMVAAAYAAAHPERSCALILANAVAATLPGARDMLAKRAATVRREGMGALLPDAVDRAFLNQPRDAAYDAYYAAFAAHDAEGYARFIEGILEADLTRELGAIACSALVIAGAHDVLLPPERSAEVAGLIPGARLEMVEAAHFVPYQNAPAFCALADAFLAEVLPQADAARAP